MKIHYVIALLVAVAVPLAAEESHLLGLGIQHDAAYLGAAKEKYLPFPLIDWEADKFFARSGKGIEEAGVHWRLNNGFSLGSQLAVELGRNSDDSVFLQQLKMRDINYGVSLGVHLEHSTHIGPAPLNTLIRLRQRSGSERGALADIRVELGVFGTDTLGLQTYLQATWANQQAMMSDFGIKPANAAYVDIPAYSPDAGIRDTVIGLAGKIDLNRDWMVVSAIEHKQLRGDAAVSPITEQKNTNTFTLGTIYRF